MMNIKGLQTRGSVGIVKPLSMYTVIEDESMRYKDHNIYYDTMTYKVTFKNSERIHKSGIKSLIAAKGTITRSINKQRCDHES